MTTRRDFRQIGADALAGRAFVDCDLMAAAPARAQARLDLILSTPGVTDADKVAMLGGTASNLLGIKA